MIIEQREILLVPFPFSDFKGSKVRPVLVLSKGQFNHSSEDVIVCGITSNLTKDYYTLRIETKDLEEGHLSAPCCIKVENILKIDKKLLLKKIGRLKEKTFANVLKKLGALFR